MSKKPSTKNTKQEILDMYNELLTQQDKVVKSDPKVAKVAEEKVAKVNTVKAITIDSLIADMAKSKTNVLVTMESFMSQLNNEVDKFNSIQEAIELAKKELQETHGVTRLLSDISDLDELKESRASAIESDIELLRSRYEDKEAELSASLVNRQNLNSREVEKLKYDLSIQRRDIKDEYDRQLKVLQDELNSLEAKREYFEDLEEKVANFDVVLAEAVQEASAKATEKAKASYGFESRAIKQSNESEVALLTQDIKNKDQKISDLESQIMELKAVNADLTIKVTDIAKASIDGASKSGQNITLAPAETSNRR